MKTIFKIAMLSSLLIGAYGYSEADVSAQPTDSYVMLSELIENAEEYDGKTILFKGEAIGDPLKRGDHTWVNVSDGNNSAVGVYMTSSQASEISTYGAYEKKGDILVITGTFHEACFEHGGDLDIHADSVQIDKAGYRMADPWSYKQLMAALFLAAAAGSLLVFALYSVRCYNSEKSGKDA